MIILCNQFVTSLNPCFNGRYSQRKKSIIESLVKNVLILVLMEDTLRDRDVKGCGEVQKVLILVLMEDTLRGFVLAIDYPIVACLNPCFNGRYSQSPTLCVGLAIIATS